MGLARITRTLVTSVVTVMTGASVFLAACITNSSSEYEVQNVMIADEPAASSPEMCVSPRPIPNLLFLRGKSDLQPVSLMILDEVAFLLENHPGVNVIIHGHTCDTGDVEGNMRLGLKRAERAKSHLVEKGIDASRVRVRSAGESEPAFPNDTPAHRACNRRVVFEVIWP